MEWRSSKSDKKTNLNDNKFDKSKKPEKNNEFKNVKNNKRFEEQEGGEKKFSFQNRKNQSNNVSLPKFKSADEIDQYLSSGKYITAQKKSKLLEIKEKLLKKDSNSNFNLSEDSFPTLVGTVETNTQSSSTCWGKKLPDSFYDTSIPFNTKFTPKPKQVQVVNSEISNDEEYDSYDEYLDDEYNEEEDYDEGF